LAEQELAEIWLGAQDREDVTEAANMIDQVLASEPLNH